MLSASQRVCVTCGRTDSPEWRKVRVAFKPPPSYTLSVSYRVRLGRRRFATPVACVGRNKQGRSTTREKVVEPTPSLNDVPRLRVRCGVLVLDRGENARLVLVKSQSLVPRSRFGSVSFRTVSVQQRCVTSPESKPTANSRRPVLGAGVDLTDFESLRWIRPIEWPGPRG